jgi:hypothetical protein
VLEKPSEEFVRDRFLVRGFHRKMHREAISLFAVE